jgi:hypothetical protein
MHISWGGGKGEGGYEENFEELKKISVKKGVSLKVK